MRRFCISAALLVAIAFATGCGSKRYSAAGIRERVAPGAPPAGQRMLIVGHSFHVFIAEPLDRLAREAGIEGHRLRQVENFGNSRPDIHWSYKRKPDAPKIWLWHDDVDVLTLALNTDSANWGVDAFADYALPRNQHLRILVQDVWMPWDSNIEYPPATARTPAARDAVTLRELMAGDARLDAGREKTREQLRAINARYGRDAVHFVPASKAVMLARERIAQGRVPMLAGQSALFADEMGHPSPPMQALIAYLWFGAIYRISPEGLEALDSEKTRESRAMHRELQRIAVEALSAEPLSGYPGARLAGADAPG